MQRRAPTSRAAHAGCAAAVPVQVVVPLTLLPAVGGPQRAQALRGPPWGKKQRQSGSGHLDRGLTSPQSLKPPPQLRGQTPHTSGPSPKQVMRLREGRTVSKATQEMSSELPIPLVSPPQPSTIPTMPGPLSTLTPQSFDSHLPFEISNGARSSTITTSIQAGNAIRQEKEIKVTVFRKGDIHLL